MIANPALTPAAKSESMRLNMLLSGTVQGVGLRPYLYRLATERGLAGWVANAGTDVILEVEGERGCLEDLQRRLRCTAPAAARIDTIEVHRLPVSGGSGFNIMSSMQVAIARDPGPADLALCATCRTELMDPGNRRYRYAFISCTQCGPRYSLIESLPYDRQATTMRDFPVCSECLTEYRDTGDRRFQHETNSCASCGPRLRLCDAAGRTQAEGTEALTAAVRALTNGAIVAAKGIGGFHLLVDATNAVAVARLRARRQRPAKPFAVLFGSLLTVRDYCVLTLTEEALLSSVAAPIVLLRPRKQNRLPGVAPESPFLGVMLPYTPLHHLLACDAGRPLVVTSGNRNEEPLVIDNQAALHNLAGIADHWLFHDRRIVHRVDDSVVRVALNRTLFLRRARGYAPAPIRTGRSLPSVLALGGQLKNTVAISQGQTVWLSPHIGELSTNATRAVAHETVQRLLATVTEPPVAVAHDSHPDYASTRSANDFPLPKVGVQHHVAHAYSCICEHNLRGPVLAVVWDGAGLGPDGTLWGGEFLRIDGGHWARLAHLRYFPLPGGEAAIREPRRTALGILFALGGRTLLEHFGSPARLGLDAGMWTRIVGMLERDLALAHTCSVGRLFDAVASLTGLVQQSSYEAQAASRVEGACGDLPEQDPYRFSLLTTARPWVGLGRADRSAH
jgi:hydrogenase maturation protein HypF